jgi:hypothetical protein
MFNNRPCYKIKAIESRENIKGNPFDLQYIYWSMEYGYLVLEFKDNLVWSLQSFIRNDVNVLNN